MAKSDKENGVPLGNERAALKAIFRTNQLKG